MRDGHPQQSTNSIFGNLDVKLASRRAFQKLEREYLYGQAGMIGGYVGKPGDRRGLASTVTKKNIKLEYEVSRPSPFDNNKLSLQAAGNERSCTDISKTMKK